MHNLNITIQVDENDDEIEQEICDRLRTIFLTSASLLDYCANSLTVTSINRED